MIFRYLFFQRPVLIFRDCFRSGKGIRKILRLGAEITAGIQAVTISGRMEGGEVLTGEIGIFTILTHMEYGEAFPGFGFLPFLFLLGFDQRINRRLLFHRDELP